MKEFRDWKFEHVELTFDMERVFEHPLLASWQAAAHEIPAPHRELMEELRQELIRNVDLYNEEELKVYFLGPLLRLIPFQAKNRRPFMDRSLSFTYGDDEVAAGRVDWMLAEGKQDPRRPYFFLHEYKREVDAAGDPLGQLLIAMVGGRRLNEAPFPLYGCYVLGRNWFFVVMEESRYAVSDAYVSTQKDLFSIYQMLKEVQVRIDALPLPV
jgi:hypothetical protein